MLISNESKEIFYLSKSFVGKTHDYSMLKDEFPDNKNWFEDFIVRVDLGFLGIEKDYKCKEVIIPRKRIKNKELSEIDKESNKNKAKERIKVEHSICGMKRYKVLSDRLRVHDFSLYDNILEVCAGLWNFYLKN